MGTTPQELDAAAFEYLVSHFYWLTGNWKFPPFWEGVFQMEQLWAVNMDTFIAEKWTEGVTSYEPLPEARVTRLRGQEGRGQRGPHPWERADVSFEGWLWEGKKPRWIRQMEWNVVCLGEAGGEWTVLQVVIAAHGHTQLQSRDQGRLTRFLPTFQRTLKEHVQGCGCCCGI